MTLEPNRPEQQFLDRRPPGRARSTLGIAPTGHRILTISDGYPVAAGVIDVSSTASINQSKEPAGKGMTDETHSTAADAPNPSATQNGSDSACADFTTTAATVGIIFVGAALIEVALIPGMVIGAAAVLAPKYVPKIGATLQPLFRSAVRGAYKVGRKAREAAAEAQEHVQDIMAEVHAEDAAPAAAAPEAPGKPPA